MKSSHIDGQHTSRLSRKILNAFKCVFLCTYKCSIYIFSQINIVSIKKFIKLYSSDKLCVLCWPEGYICCIKSFIKVEENLSIYVC